MFPVSTVEKWFGWISPTFRASVLPRWEKLKIWPVWLYFEPETYPQYSGRNSYRFAISTTQKWFRRIFRARTLPLQAELKIGPGWLCFDSQNIPTLFERYFLSFMIGTGKDGLRQIFTTFSGPATTEKEKLKMGPDDSVERPKRTHTFWGAILIVSSQYDKKMFLSNSDNFSGAERNRPRQSWKLDLDDYVWHPKHTHTICGAVFMFPVSTTEAGKVENRARMTPFCTRNISTYSGRSSYRFAISTAEKIFRRILTTFSGQSTTAAGRV